MTRWYDNLKTFFQILYFGLPIPMAYAYFDDNAGAARAIWILWILSWIVWTILRVSYPSPRYEALTHNYLADAPPPRTIRVTWYDDQGVLRRRSI